MRRFWRMALFGVVVVVMFGSSGQARQPGLELPPWAELVVHFAEPPEVGRTVQLLTHIQILQTDGGEAMLQVELPSGLRLVEGQRTIVLPMEAGLRHLHVMNVQVRLPISAGIVQAQLTAPLPRRSLEATIRRDTSSPELLTQRLALLRTQPAQGKVDGVVRFSSTRVEASSGGDSGPSWQRVIRGPAGAGVFIVRPSPVSSSREELVERIVAFERHEELVASRPALRAALAARPEARQAAAATYGDELHALAIRLFDDRTQDTAELAVLYTKASTRDGVLAESRAAIANLYAVALVANGQLDEALRVWADAVEDRRLGSLRAYLLFNAGEAQRISGREADSLEWFESALEMRPGLTIARSRLP